MAALVFTGQETLEEFRDKLLTHEPIEIDQALRAKSGSYDYPPAFIGKYFIPIKQGIRDPLTAQADEKLVEAGQYSFKLRRRATANGKRSGLEDGSYTTIIIPNKENPMESLALLVQRNAGHGPGLGCLGGRLERDRDKNPDGSLNYLPKREMKEELIQEYELEGAEKDQVRKIIANLQMQPLFTSRDDAHYIDRGWGFTFNSHAHLGTVPEELQAEALEVFGKLAAKDAAIAAADPNREVNGVKLVPLKDLHEHIPHFHYAHEAFATSVAATIALAKLNYEGMGEKTSKIKLKRTMLDWIFGRHPTKEVDNGTVLERGPLTPLAEAESAIPYDSSMQKTLALLQYSYGEIVEDALDNKLAAPGQAPHIAFDAVDYQNQEMLDTTDGPKNLVNDQVTIPDHIVVKDATGAKAQVTSGDTITITEDNRAKLSTGFIMTGPITILRAVINEQEIPLDPAKSLIHIQDPQTGESLPLGGLIPVEPDYYGQSQPALEVGDIEAGGRMNGAGRQI